MYSIIIALDYFSALILLLLIVAVLTMKENSLKKDRYLLLFTITMALLFVVDGTGYLLNNSKYITISKILTCINLPILNVGLIFFHSYLKSMIKSDNKIFKFDTIILSIIALISSIFWVVIIHENGFTNISDFNDLNYIKYYYFVISLSTILMVYDLVLVIINIRKFSRKSMIAWSFFGILPIIVLILDNIYNMSFLYPVLTFSILLVYLVVFIERNSRYYLSQVELSEKNLELENIKVKVIMSQIQPHFLYNVLSSIMAIPGNPKETKDAIGDFSNYLRKNLDSVNLDEAIPFENELNHAKLYVKLEQLRFGDEVNVEYNIKTMDFKVPVLCLQMLVENAIKHGITLKRGGGTVKVSAKKYKKEYIITVEDDGVGFDTTKKLDDSRSHVGLESTRKRLNLMVNGTLDIESKIGKGTKATIRIPEKENN